MEMGKKLCVFTVILILLATMLWVTKVTNANFFNTNNFYPVPIPPAVTIHSPLNNTIMNSTKVCLAFTLDISAKVHDSYGLFVHCIITNVSYSLDEAEPILLDNNTINDLHGNAQAIDFSANLTSLTEGPHRLIVSVAYSSFYPAVTNSTSPTAFMNSTTAFTVLTQPSPSPTTDPAYTQTSSVYPGVTAFLASVAIFTILVLFLLVCSKRRRV